MNIAGAAIVAYFLKRTIHPFLDESRVDAMVTSLKGHRKHFLCHVQSHRLSCFLQNKKHKRK